MPRVRGCAVRQGGLSFLESQLRAMRQSRYTVRSDTPSTLAVSSTLRPARKRSSPMRA